MMITHHELCPWSYLFPKSVLFEGLQVVPYFLRDVLHEVMRVRMR